MTSLSRAESDLENKTFVEFIDEVVFSIVQKKNPPVCTCGHFKLALIFASFRLWSREMQRHLLKMCQQVRRKSKQGFKMSQHSETKRPTLVSKMDPVLCEAALTDSTLKERLNCDVALGLIMYWVCPVSFWTPSQSPGLCLLILILLSSVSADWPTARTREQRQSLGEGKSGTNWREDNQEDRG